jgi:hypothetical protein
MSTEIVSYRDLVVWQRAIELADLVYTITDAFPARERYGLAFQMRKAAVSIASNIAEGTTSNTRLSLAHRHRAWRTCGARDASSDRTQTSAYFGQ